MSIENLLKRAIDKYQVKEPFTWHLHSMDAHNIARIQGRSGTFGSRLPQDLLLGFGVHVDDRYPRNVWLKDEEECPTDASYVIQPEALVLWSMLKGPPPIKTLGEQLGEVLAGAKRNDLLPPGFAWYFHPGLVEEWKKQMVWDPHALLDHPDTTTASYRGYRVRNDPGGPWNTATASGLLETSIRLTNADKDYHQMNARRWGCLRANAKNRIISIFMGVNDPYPKLPAVTDQDLQVAARYFSGCLPNFTNHEKCTEPSKEKWADEIREYAIKDVAVSNRLRSDYELRDNLINHLERLDRLAPLARRGEWGSILRSLNNVQDKVITMLNRTGLSKKDAP